MTPPARKPPLPSLHIVSRAERDAERMPPDGTTPGLDAPFRLDLTAGLDPKYTMPRHEASEP